MLFSGYQLGVHLLNSTFGKLALVRKDSIKNRHSISVFEKHLDQYVTSRNSIFIVEGIFINANVKTKYFVKQPRFKDSNYISSIFNENYILKIFKDARINSLDNLIGFDNYQSLLFLKFIDGKSFDTSAEPEKDDIKNLLQNLAIIVSDAHDITFTSLKNQKYPDKFGYRKPILLSYTKRDFEGMVIDGVSKETESVVEILQKNNYELLDKIKDFTWTQDSLIHFDFKFEHLIIEDDGSIKTIVDWEMGDMGDIHWDIASIWFEILQPHFCGWEVEPLMKLSIEYLNVFLAKYSRKIDDVKLQNFLGVLILHKHFYRLLGIEGVDSKTVNKWLEKAVSLINSTTKIGVFENNNVQSSSLTIAFKEEETDFDSDIRGNLGTTIKQIDEISQKLFDVYIKDTTSLDKPQMSEFIYSWFNGNKVKENRKDVLAESPKLGKEIMLEDFWWQVEGYSKNNSVVIRKGSERRMAEPGAFIYLNHNSKNIYSLTNKSFVKLQFPNYMVRPNDAQPNSNDLWVMSSQQIRQDYGNWIRFYFNLKGDFEGINLFIDNISEKLNERSIPFELKLRNALSSYTRTDVAILFVHRQHFNACIDTVAYVYNLLLKGNYLDTGTPKFTKLFKKIKNRADIYDGFAFAENPSESSESFGNWRAKIISKMLANNLNSFKTAEDLSKFIKQGLNKMGFNIFEFYRNPYPKEFEYKFRYVLLEGENGKLENPPLLDSGIISSLKYLPSQRFLKAARSVAFVLCREAIWYGDYCTWIGYKKDEDGKGYFETMNKSESLGIALFLCYITIFCPTDSIFKECTYGILKSYRDFDEKKDIKEWLDFIKTKLKVKKLLPVLSETSQIDLLNIEIRALYRDEFNQNEAKSKFLADVLIEKYVDKKIPLPNGYSDDWNDLNGTEFNPTVTHGLAGLGYFLLTLIGSKDHPIIPLKTFFL
jgi:HopA1 effector protein family/Phosphotransferase enzyme family